MMTFSLKWFKEKIKSTVEEIVKNRVDLAVEQLEKEQTYEKPYIKVKLVNDALTIVLNNGDIISRTGVSEELYNKVLSASSVEQINILLSEENYLRETEKDHQERLRLMNVMKGVEVLRNVSDFQIKDGAVYLRGINRTLPQLLVEKFCEIISKYRNCPAEDLQNALNEDDEYNAHKRFFMWCCLNPRAEVADSLYDFLMRNSFRITKQGFFAALRNVVTLHGSNELVQFVSNTYNKVKAVWKKSPDNYTVFLENGEYKLVHDEDLYNTEVVTCENCDGTGEVWNDETEEMDCCIDCSGEGVYEETTEIDHGQRIGGLTDLYLDLPNRHENRFTDDWTKTFDIRIGQVVNMPMNECNWSTQDCAAAGLHFTADQIHYVGCGDQSVLVLINPMKVVGIGEHKGRCYEYLPIMTVPREEATELLHDLNFDTLQLDESYVVRELDNLTEKVAEGFAEEAKKHTFNIPCISNSEVNCIVNSLEGMKEEISKRIVKID